jgi:hypothetical protein
MAEIASEAAVTTVLLSSHLDCLEVGMLSS